MTAITLRGFGGLRPRVDDKLLKDHEAAQADNCDLAHGSIASWRKRKETVELAKAGLIKTIYLFDDTYWLHWNEDVDVVKGPISGDLTERTYFTGTDVPRVTDNTLVDSADAVSGVITGATQADPVVITDVAHGLSTGAKIAVANVVGMTEINGQTFTVTVLTVDTFELDGEDGTGHTAYTSGGTWSRVLEEYPEDSYQIGVPAPITKPTLTKLGTPDEGVITGATQANPVVITDVGHGLTTGMSITIVGISGMIEINNRTFTITQLTADTFELDEEDGTGHTAYVSGGTWTRNATFISRAYVYTFVNDWGEESAPSPVSIIIDVDEDNQTVDLTGMDGEPTGDYNNIGKWRIYRVATGVSGSAYLFVAEVVINTSSPQYNDGILQGALAEALQTTGWLPPPSDLIGLTLMGNGIMAGFAGNELYFSEPFLPYAWPDEYRLTTDYQIVGIGSFGNSLVVVTEGFPYIVTGTTPEQMSLDKLSYRHPGIAKRTIISVAGGVIWASPSGLFYVGDAGNRLLTDEHYTRNEWSALVPENSFAAFYDMRYVAFMPSVNKAIVYSIPEKRLTRFDAEMDALFSDIKGDRLYFANDEAGVNTVFEFNAGGTRETYTYKSKMFTLNNRVAITAGKVYADYEAGLSDEELAELETERAAIIASNIALLIDTGGGMSDHALNEVDMNGDNLQDIPEAPQAVSFVFRLYNGAGDLLFEKQVINNKPFRIKALNKYVEYQIEVSGQFPIQMVKIGTSIMEAS